MITNAITHYQTSFQAKARKNQHKPLKIIQKFVYEWLKNKEKDPICIRDKSNFFNKCAWNELRVENVESLEAKAVTRIKARPRSYLRTLKIRFLMSVVFT